VGDYENAFADANSAIRRAPKSPDVVGAYEARGRVYLVRKDYDLAIADLTTAIELRPSQAYFFRALAYMAKHEWRHALNDLNETVMNMPSEAHVFCARSVVRASLEDIDGAIDDMSKAIELEPRNADHYAARAKLFRERREAGCAIADYTNAIKLAQKSDASTLHNWHRWRGALRFFEGDLDGAIEDGSAAIRYSPQDGNGYMIRGVATLRKLGYGPDGGSRGAIADMSKAAELIPNDGEWGELQYWLKEK
jgi:tetratricopeptide (TPR) repeat protein